MVMKEKQVKKARKAEWEKFLKANQQLPVYMGDHMTRQWTKREGATDVDGEEKITNNNSVKTRHSLRRACSRADSQIGKAITPGKSQYSIRKVTNGKKKFKSYKEILMHHQITKEDISKWQESFDVLLNTPGGRYVFKLFLESEVADENLRFWLACEELKNSKQKKVEKRIQDIYDTYINVYSPHEINIDYKMRVDIVEQLKLNMDASVFTEAQHQVYYLMHRDSYPRFLSSNFLAELIKAVSESPVSEKKSTANIAKDNVSLKSTSGFMSCCYCRNNSEQDITTLVEEQQTTSISAANKSLEVPVSAEKEEPKNLSSHKEVKESAADTKFNTDKISK